MNYIDYIEKASKIKYKKENKNLNIAILRSYTCENIEPILKTELFNENINVNIKFGIFNQYFQEIMDDNSFIYTDSIDLVLILIRPQDLFTRIFEVEECDLNKEKQNNLEMIEKIINRLNQKSKNVIFVNMEEYENEPKGILEYNEKQSIVNILKQFNSELISLKEFYSNMYLIDINKIISDIGKRNTYNLKFKYISRDPYHIEFYIELTKYIKRIIKAIYCGPKKVLVVDLDNTLYKGILGEDEIDKITNFEEYPGAHYKNLQIKIKNIKHRGVLLALATKNNYSDVEKLFSTDKMILKMDDFIAIKANWKDKYINIREISEELNLNLDSFVFMDDNPYEIDMVNKMLPSVTTIKVSSKPQEVENIFEDFEIFDVINITEEDRKRSDMYKIRKKIKFEEENVEHFLKDLNMEVLFKFVHKEDKNLIERASQMTLKTNQFNMTTKRYSLQEIKNILENDNNIIVMMFVKDKFGDNGSTGLCILKNNEIDTFLLSCRVLKRNLEFCMLNLAKDIIKNKSKEKKVIAKYIETSKNKAFSQFYKQAGLNEFEDNVYMMNVDEQLKFLPDYINIKIEGM